MVKESIDFPEQMRFVNLQRLLYGLQTVKLSASVSVKDDQVLCLLAYIVHSFECKIHCWQLALHIQSFQSV